MWEFLAAVLAAAPTNIFGICQAAEAKYIIGKSPYFWCCNQGKEERKKERQGNATMITGWSNHAWIDDAANDAHDRGDENGDCMRQV